MISKNFLVALAASGWVFAHATVGHGATVDSCLSRKIVDAGKSAAARTGCYARDAAKPDPTALAICLDKASRRFGGAPGVTDGQFEKLERLWQCVTVDDQAAFDADLAAFAAALDEQVGNPGTPSKCD